MEETCNSIGVSGPAGYAATFKCLQLGKCHCGRGVFAGENIRKGEFILKFGGSLMGTLDLPNPLPPQEDYFLQIGNGLFLGPSGDVDDYVNHSCHPNTGIVISGQEAWLRAIRPIPAGSEISFDYSTTMFEWDTELDCTCGTSRCRKRIGGFSRLHHATRARYMRLGVVPPFVLEPGAGVRV